MRKGAFVLIFLVWAFITIITPTLVQWSIVAAQPHPQVTTHDSIHEKLNNDIPLVAPLPCDSRYWWPNAEGVYTVKSGYWLGRLGAERAWATMLGGGGGDLWKRVWGLDGPPKLSHFIWRACKGSLAVNERLHRRHVSPSRVCSVCGAMEETIIHSLFYCSFAHPIWQPSEFAELLLDAPSSSFADRFMWVAGKVDNDSLRRFATLAWAAWTCRNKAIFEAEVRSPVTLAAGFAKMVADFREYKAQVTHPSASLGRGIIGSWEKPPDGWIKVNVDAHVSESGYVGLGAVARDAAGSLVAAAVRRVSARWEAGMTEAAAALFGVMMARRLGCPRVWLESDAVNVVNAISRRTPGRSPIFLFYQQILDVSLSFNAFRCSHIRRGGNTAAHLVARWDVNIDEEFMCTEHFPPSLTTLGDLDIS